MHNFEDINESLGIPSKWKKIKKAHLAKFIPLSTGNRGKGIYPWTDPSFEIGDSFFKPMSKEDVKSNKGRPSVSAAAKHVNFYWKTSGVYSEDYKQYGYLVTRVKPPERPDGLFR